MAPRVLLTRPREDAAAFAVLLEQKGYRPAIEPRLLIEPVPAVLDGERLTFSDPQEAVAPGQTVAFYDDDLVLGGALIADTFL